MLELTFPPPVTKCKECQHFHYIDHDLVYCSICSHPMQETPKAPKVIIPPPLPTSKKKTWW